MFAVATAINSFLPKLEEIGHLVTVTIIRRKLFFAECHLLVGIE